MISRKKLNSVSVKISRTDYDKARDIAQRQFRPITFILSDALAAYVRAGCPMQRMSHFIKEESPIAEKP